MLLRPISHTTSARIPTEAGEFRLCHYQDETDGKEHLALVLGDVANSTQILTRVHSECFTGDVMGSLRCDCGEQLQRAMQMIASAGRGVIIYLRQEGRGIGLAEKLRAYNLQDEGYDTVEANLLLGHQADERKYDAAAAILTDLNVTAIRLLTNNPDKIERLQALGISVVDRIPLQPNITPDNEAYLTAKVARMRHLLTLSDSNSIHGDDAHSDGAYSDVAHEDFIHRNTADGSSLSAHHHTNGMASALASPLTPAIQERLTALQTRAATYHQEYGRPFVNLSFAQSLDGSIAATRGQPLALSSQESMTLTHALRANHDAILIGIGTALADNPRLNVRLVDGPNPQPIVVDSQLRLAPDARLFEQHETVWVATACQDAARRAALEARGGRILHLPTTASGIVDLAALLDQIGGLGMRSLMVEGGATILTSFLTQRLANYVTMTIAPTFVGGLRVLDAYTSVVPMPQQYLTAASFTQVGPDMVVWGELMAGLPHD